MNLQMAWIFTFWSHSNLNDRKSYSKVTRTARGKALNIGVPERKPFCWPNTRSRHWWSGHLRICSLILRYTEERWCIRWRRVGSSKDLAGERTNQREATLRKRRPGGGDEHSLPAPGGVWQSGLDLKITL